jgi:ornithine cyclodeaminase
VHINAVGACRPDTRELDTAALKMGRLFGDSTESVLSESGDFIIPFSAKEIGREHLLGEIGDVIRGAVQGRTSDDDITIFKSLGLAIEDLASADLIYRRYMAEGGE